MRLAYTAVTTLAALLSCSHSVPTAGDPKAVLKQDVSQFVARGTDGDDYKVNTKRLLRNAHVQGTLEEALLLEERTGLVETVGVWIGNGIKFVSRKAGPAVDKHLGELGAAAGRIVIDEVKQKVLFVGKLLKLLVPIKKMLLEFPAFKKIDEWFKMMKGSKPVVVDAEKSTTTSGLANLVKEKGKAIANGEVYTTHDAKPPLIPVTHPGGGGQPTVSHNNPAPPPAN
uniref:Uncharacterized protein n=1 Tax=Peronospora matthiolae TaxID=2874970 RepID=A0AAV1USW8_9STRA